MPKTDSQCSLEDKEKKLSSSSEKKKSKGCKSSVSPSKNKVCNTMPKDEKKDVLNNNITSDIIKLSNSSFHSSFSPENDNNMSNNKKTMSEAIKLGIKNLNLGAKKSNDVDDTGDFDKRVGQSGNSDNDIGDLQSNSSLQDMSSCFCYDSDADVLTIYKKCINYDSEFVENLIERARKCTPACVTISHSDDGVVFIGDRGSKLVAKSVLEFVKQEVNSKQQFDDNVGNKSVTTIDDIVSNTSISNAISSYDRRDRDHRQPRREKNHGDCSCAPEEIIVNKEQVVYVKELREKKLDELLQIANKYQVQNLNRMLRQDIITSILKQAALKGEGLYTDGCLEIVDDGFGFLRDSKNNYKASSYDAYISQSQIKKFGLRQGDNLCAYIKEPRRNERFFSVVLLEKINGRKIEDIRNKINFDNLIPLYPTEKLKFDRVSNPKEAISTRMIDLICPIGKGQRALIVAPPRTGKTFLMQSIAHAINENHPESKLIVLLIDERPEEVTDMVRSVKGEVVSSTFDEPAKRHVELAEIVIEKAKRMVEDNEDVIILLDSITRLARAYNATAPSSGKVLTGGVDSNALQKPKRFFGAARNIENGGSLTIIATALVETGSKMDEVIFEEFKGTGNSEIVLDRKLSDKRLFPALDILKSGTRREEEMVSKDDLQKMWILRRILIQMAGTAANNSSDALEFLIGKLKASKDNKEFFLQMNGSGKSI